MGKIRTRNIKKFVLHFLDTNLGLLSTNFEENKQILKRILSPNITKRLRNKINGYLVCRLRKSN